MRVMWLAAVLVLVDVVADLLAGRLHIGGTWLFAVSVVALVPLAFVIGEATEQVGEHTGPGIAGLLNATFGNAPELIIALFAVDRGLFEFVRGSLTGSVVSNLLLVLGASIAAGRVGSLDRRRGAGWLVQTAVASCLFVIPAVAHGWDGGDRRFLAGPTVPVVVVLLVAYVVMTTRHVRR